MSRRSKPSPRVGTEWLIEGQRARFEVAYTGDADEAERIWRDRRPSEKQHWDWRRFVRTHRDSYAIRAATLVALWSGAAVPARRDYALQYLEVAPEHRGRGVWGRLAVFSALARAEELGLQRVVFQAPAERVSWYTRLGAKDGAAGWVSDPHLVLMHFDADLMAKAAKELDGCRHP